MEAVFWLTGSKTIKQSEANWENSRKQTGVFAGLVLGDTIPFIINVAYETMTNVLLVQPVAYSIKDSFLSQTSLKTN